MEKLRGKRATSFLEEEYAFAARVQKLDAADPAKWHELSVGTGITTIEELSSTEYLVGKKAYIGSVPSDLAVVASGRGIHTSWVYARHNRGALYGRGSARLHATLHSGVIEGHDQSVIQIGSSYPSSFVSLDHRSVATIGGKGQGRMVLDGASQLYVPGGAEGFEHIRQLRGGRLILPEGHRVSPHLVDSTIVLTGQMSPIGVRDRLLYLQEGVLGTERYLGLFGMSASPQLGDTYLIRAFPEHQWNLLQDTIVQMMR